MTLLTLDGYARFADEVKIARSTAKGDKCIG